MNRRFSNITFSNGCILQDMKIKSVGSAFFIFGLNDGLFYDLAYVVP